jgi:hypothetical protein
MNKDQVWEQIKNDKTKIYGESLLDVFLKTTSEIEQKHILEFPEKIEYLNNECLNNLVWKTDASEIFKLIIEKVKSPEVWRRICDKDNVSSEILDEMVEKLLKLKENNYKIFNSLTANQKLSSKSISKIYKKFDSFQDLKTESDEILSVSEFSIALSSISDKIRKVWLLKKICLNKNTPEFIIRDIFQNNNEFFKEFLAWNKNLPSDIIIELSKQNKFKELIAKNTSTPPEVLKSMALEQDFNNTKEIMTFYGKGGVWPIWDILQNPNTPADILEKFFHKGKSFWRYIANNPKIPTYLMKKITDKRPDPW